MRRDPLEADAATLHVIALQKLDRPLEAVEYLQSAEGRDALDEALRRLLCSLGLFQAGRDEEAADELERALRANPLIAAELEGTDLLRKAAEFPQIRRVLRLEGATMSYV
jgi:tetratricopeptide (TPR) repeat protein